jgi:hypothetical protein
MNEWSNQIIDIRKSIQRWTEGDEPEVSHSVLSLQYNNGYYCISYNTYTTYDTSNTVCVCVHSV